jgi:hypothetical protein
MICGVTEKRSPPLSLMKMAKVSLGDAVEGARGNGSIEANARTVRC